MESHAVSNSLLEHQHHFSEHQSKWLRFKNSFTKQNFSRAFTITSVRQYIAEFIGTLLIVYVGTGTVVALAAKDALNAASSNTCIALSFGFAVACMVYATANVSGGHLNPAITIAFLATGNIDIIRGVGYIIFQCLGAMAASGLIRGVTPRDSWEIVSGGATQLGQGISVVQGVFLELIITYMLIFTVFGTVQLRNSSTGMGKLAGLAIGLAVLVSHTFGQSFTGPGMNPARSLGPAIVFNQWTNHWIYWVGPISGGLFAALTYQFVLQPEDAERRDLKYKRKLAAKKQKELAKHNRAQHPGRLSNALRRKALVTRNSEPVIYKSVDQAGPITIDDKKILHNTSVMSAPSLQSEESFDRDSFTMDINDAVGQGQHNTPQEDPNFSDDEDSVINNPASTRIR